MILYTRGRPRARARFGIGGACLLAGTLFSVLAAAGETLPDEKALEGSVLTLRARNKPVKSLLAKIEKETGNPIQIVDKFRRPMTGVLEKKVSLDLEDALFWDVLTELERVTQTVFSQLEDGSIQLMPADEISDIGRDAVIGEAITTGPFRVVPCYSEFFHHLVISLQPEPSVGRIEANEEQLELVLQTVKGGEVVLPAHSFTGTNNITGALDLKFELEVDRDEIPLEEIRSAKIRGALLAVEAKTHSLASVGKLLKEKGPKKVGLVEFQVKSAGFVDEDGERVFEIEIEVEGPLVKHSDLALLDRKGEPLSLHSGQGALGTGKRQMKIGYLQSEVGDKATALKLSLHAPTKITPHPIELNFDPLSSAKDSDG